MDANPGLIQTAVKRRDSPGPDDRHAVELAGVALACCVWSGHLPTERPHRGRLLTRAFLFFRARRARSWALRLALGRRSWANRRRWWRNIQQLTRRRRAFSVAARAFRRRGEYRLLISTPGSAQGRPNCRCRSRHRSLRLSHPQRHRFTGRWRFRQAEDRWTAGRPDARSRHRHHAGAKPRSPRKVHGDSACSRRHVAGEPAIKPNFLPRRSALAVCAARARSSRGRHRAGRNSLTPTSAIPSTSHTSDRLGRWWRPAPSEFWRLCTRMPSASGSTMFTAHMSRPWRRARRFAMRRRAWKGWESSGRSTSRRHQERCDLARRVEHREDQVPESTDSAWLMRRHRTARPRWTWDRS